MIACGDTIGSSGEAIMIQILRAITYHIPLPRKRAARVHSFLDAYMHDLQNHDAIAY